MYVLYREKKIELHGICIARLTNVFCFVPITLLLNLYHERTLSSIYLFRHQLRYFHDHVHGFFHGLNGYKFVSSVKI